MNWNQQLETIRWRALEEAGAGSDGWRADIRQEATARTRQDLRAATAEFASAADIDAFLDKRTSALDDISKGRDGTLDEERRRMKAPSLRGGWAWSGWALALVFGFGLTGLGADREINLLSLPEGDSGGGFESCCGEIQRIQSAFGDVAGRGEGKGVVAFSRGDSGAGECHGNVCQRMVEGVSRGVGEHAFG